MAKVKRLFHSLMASSVFWIFWILSMMVMFITRFERPVNFVVDKIYRLF